MREYFAILKPMYNPLPSPQEKKRSGGLKIFLDRRGGEGRGGGSCTQTMLSGLIDVVVNCQDLCKLDKNFPNINGWFYLPGVRFSKLPKSFRARKRFLKFNLFQVAVKVLARKPVQSGSSA